MECRDERTRRLRVLRYEDRSCLICGTVFNTAKKSQDKLCGMKCVGANNGNLKRGIHKVPHEDVICKNSGCDATITRRVTDSGNEFCSKKCRGQFFYSTTNLRSKLISKKWKVVLLDGSTLVVRSKWEAAFIKDYLERREFLWSYEKKIIDLDDGRVYVPDFHLTEDDVFVEVKGFERGPSLEKVLMARSMGYNVIYATHKALTRVFGLDLSQKHLNSLVEAVV